MPSPRLSSGIIWATIVPVAVLATPRAIPCKSLFISRNGRLIAPKYNADVIIKNITPTVKIFLLPISSIMRPAPNRPIKAPIIMIPATSPAGSYSDHQ